MSKEILKQEMLDNLIIQKDQVKIIKQNYFGTEQKYETTVKIDNEHSQQNYLILLL